MTLYSVRPSAVFVSIIFFTRRVYSTSVWLWYTGAPVVALIPPGNCRNTHVIFYDDARNNIDRFCEKLKKFDSR